jgi:GTP1/Obg family GTP-binding protein
LPSDWFVGTASVSVDREEIIVTGELPPVSAEAPQGQSAAAAAGRISRFREETRAERMKIAAEAEARYGRKVSWGAQLGNTRVLFTHLSIPVMTRLRQPERQVLDTLVDAGVARSRSEALSWAVSLVGQHADEWLASLRQAMSEVDKLRAQGPDL